MYQEVIVYLIFGIALFYLLFRTYKSIRSKNGGGACAGCSAIDLSKTKAQSKTNSYNRVGR